MRHLVRLLVPLLVLFAAGWSSSSDGPGSSTLKAIDPAAFRAVVAEVFNAGFQQQWIDSRQADDPAAPDGQQYGYGISYQRFGPDAAMFYHGGELPGFNSFIGHDSGNDVTLVIWTDLTLSPEAATTANAMLPTVLKEITPTCRSFPVLGMWRLRLA